ncbi:hypothetical protein Vretifemale_8002 [Volvox reticuliferus]|uniref:Uncharacterized protein n=1 Tax=Volvox reticuliferus TaxID=1737510 RepID=A0A8J4FP02_9CHLO|nr:hypothetical protein Vretifemale_8002 [Volvox reticuliferus]
MRTVWSDEENSDMAGRQFSELREKRSSWAGGQPHPYGPGKDAASHAEYNSGYSSTEPDMPTARSAGTESSWTGISHMEEEPQQRAVAVPDASSSDNLANADQPQRLTQQAQPAVFQTDLAWDPGAATQPQIPSQAQARDLGRDHERNEVDEAEVKLLHRTSIEQEKPPYQQPHQQPRLPRRTHPPVRGGHVSPGSASETTTSIRETSSMFSWVRSWSWLSFGRFASGSRSQSDKSGSEPKSGLRLGSGFGSTNDGDQGDASSASYLSDPKYATAGEDYASEVADGGLTDGFDHLHEVTNAGATAVANARLNADDSSSSSSAAKAGSSSRPSSSSSSNSGIRSCSTVGNSPDSDDSGTRSSSSSSSSKSGGINEDIGDGDGDGNVGAAGGGGGGVPAAAIATAVKSQRRSLVDNGNYYCISSETGSCSPCNYDPVYQMEPCYNDDDHGTNSDVCLKYGSWYSTVYGNTMCSGIPEWLSFVNVTLPSGSLVVAGLLEAWEDTGGYMVVTLRLNCPWMMKLDSATAGQSLAITVTQVGVTGAIEGTWNFSISSTTDPSAPFRSCSSVRFPIRGSAAGSSAVSGAACSSYNRILTVQASVVQKTANLDTWDVMTCRARL